MFYEQLDYICKQKGTTPTGLLKKLGLSTSKVTAWKKGSIPKAQIIQRLADELGVSTDCFFGGSGTDILSEEEQELISVFRNLPKSGKRQLLGKAYELLDKKSQCQIGDEITPPDIDLVTPVLDRRIKK